MPLDIEALLAEAELPETSVTLCLKGGLVSRFEALDVHLRGLPSTPTSLAGDSEAATIAAELEQLRAEMAAFERVFSFRALPPLAFAVLRDALPVKKDGEDYDAAYYQWMCRLVSATCYDPAMTPEQTDRLVGKLSNGQWQRLCNAAWLINTDNSAIPFSAAGYALTQTSAARPPQPEPPASPEVNSLAGPAEASSSTNTPTGS